MLLHPMRLIYLLTTVVILWKKSDAAESNNYNITVGSVSSICTASYITPQSLSVGCSDDGGCKVGDSIELDAVVQLSGLESSTVVVSLIAKVLWFTHDIVKNVEVDICASAISLDGATCPEDGTYELTTLAFPLTSQYTYLTGRNITAEMTAYDSSGNSLGCAKTTVKLVKSASTGTAYGAFVVLPLAGLTIAASLYKRYKVKTQTLDLDGNADTPGTYFVGSALA